MNTPRILYQDDAILVCEKPAGTAVQTSRVTEPDLASLLKNELYRQTGKQNPYVGVIHRLDQPVCGLLVFALQQKAAGALNRQMTAGGFSKDYLAIVKGTVKEGETVLTDWLLKDGRTNTSRVVKAGTKDAKLARLSYRRVEAKKGEAHSLPEGTSLVQVTLDTGRHHQIRVQMAHAGHPLLGDAKYDAAGKEEGWRQIALCAYHLAFLHPITKKSMEFHVKPWFLEEK